MPRLSDLLSDHTDKDALSKFISSQKQKQPRGRVAPPRQEKRQPRFSFNVLPAYIAIDVETTGLDHKHDRIIEIGLARFVHGQYREQYLRYVNPGVTIPAAITNLTGITDAAVKDAPSFTAIAAELLEFIGDLPLCGHQVEFDFNFLNQELARCSRTPINNLQIDTAMLSRIMLPGLAGYSLGHVARTLGITLESAHRAMDDAIASGNIAATLVPRLEEIPVRSRRIMAQFAPPSVLKKLLFRSIDNCVDGPSPAARQEPLVSSVKLTIPQEPVAIDDAAVDRCFGDQGRLSAELPGYVPRQGQISMATAVTAALNGRQNLVVEAGTGIGKSLAYLLPAATWAFANNTRVLISTHTRNLQDQLVSKDLPLAQKAVGAGLRFSILKGRANYLCLNRWGRLLSGEIGNLSRHERFGLLPLIRWAEETVTGDIEEQNQFNRRWFPKVWNLVSADSHECKGHRCPQHERCFVQNARQKALASHVVVINHALFFSDICAETSFLGKISAIVFDEAHHLEACGHRYLRVEVDTNRINAYTEFMNNLVKVLERATASSEVAELVKRFKSVLKNIRRSGHDFLSEMMAWVARTHADAPQLFHFDYRDQPFTAVRGLAEMEMVINEMQDVLLNLQRVLSSGESSDDGHVGDIGGCVERTSQLKADLLYVTRAVTEDHVFWIEGDRVKGWIKLSGVPLDVGTILGDIWSQPSRVSIFTSATLAVSDSMDFFMQRIGLRGEVRSATQALIIKSPFAENQMARLAVRGSLDPTAPAYEQFVAGGIVELLNRFEKNILVLFTANEMLNAVAATLKQNPAFPRKATLLAQTASANRHVLLEQFKSSRHAVLLGTDSFWEGIDAPGQACEIVVITRLPFAVPTHPLALALARRCEQETGESFVSYTVPQAVIKFKQGAGRLIRTPQDRGALIVLDPRLVTKGYGKLFQRSIGGSFSECASFEQVLAQTAAFFDGEPQPGDGPRYVPLDESC